jgi:hypothetical protein
MADVNVPKVGKVSKKVLIPIAVAAGGFVAYKYWVARKNVGSGEDVAVDPGMEDPGTIPGVSGAVSPTNSYGSGSGSSGGDTGGGFRGLTNSEWTDYVTTRLQQSETWSYTDIAVALGNFIDNRPLSDSQQAIARAAIGIAGYPPVGSHTIISGGNTPITVAPTGLSGSATPTTISVAFTPVAGAVTYNGYRTNSTGATNNAQATSNSSPVQFTGLAPGTAYSIQIAAVSASGAVGPKSAPITVKTPGVKMGTPAKPSVSGVTASKALLQTAPVPYATTYRWFVSGRLVATTPNPTWTATGMKGKTRYTAAVSAQSSGGTSPTSAATPFTTK